MFQLRVKLPREIIAHWFIHYAQDYFYPLYERMHELLLHQNLSNANETTCQLLREKERPAQSTSYMWIYLSGSDGMDPIVLCDYPPGRGSKYRAPRVNYAIRYLIHHLLYFQRNKI